MISVSNLSKLFLLIFSLCFLSSVAFSDTSEIDEKITVLGKKIDGINPGDYFMYSVLMGQLAKLEWQREQARISQSDSPPSNDNTDDSDSPELEREKCEADAVLEHSLCVQAAARKLDRKIKTECTSYVRSGSVSLGPTGDWGAHTEYRNPTCVEGHKITKDAEEAHCNTQKALEDRLCLN